MEDITSREDETSKEDIEAELSREGSVAGTEMNKSKSNVNESIDDISEEPIYDNLQNFLSSGSLATQNIPKNLYIQSHPPEIVPEKLRPRNNTPVYNFANSSTLESEDDPNSFKEAMNLPEMMIIMMISEP